MTYAANSDTDVTSEGTVVINAVNGLLGMSVVVAVIGIINTLSLSIFERRRELGLLRVVGMLDRDVRRMVNLLQVSSAFGRAMEAVDRRAMSQALYPALRALRQDKRLDALELDAAVAACAEGYSFPTNLDTDPPLGGNAPETQADILRRAVEAEWGAAAFGEALAALAARQRA